MVSLSIDYPFKTPQLQKTVSPDDVIGLDYSQEQLYVDSNGQIADYTRYHKMMEKRQRRMNQSLARKKNNAKTDENGTILYSKNYQKQVCEYQKVMTKVKNKRRDTLHKMTNQITNDYQAVVVEDIDLRNLAQCLRLGKKLHDNGFGLFRTMLKYKCERKGKHYMVADKYFASSKTCSCCGNKKDTLTLSERIYNCIECGTKIDRDYNAARNLKQYGIRMLHERNELSA